MLNFFDNTSQQLFNSTLQFWNNIPKNETEIKKSLQKLKSVFETEFEKSKGMWEIYAKAAKGEATMNELHDANRMCQELMITARFAAILAIPGAIFVLPQLVKTAQQFGVDLVPQSVAKQFKI